MKPLSATQRGYSLVELAISVAILSVLIVAGLTGVQSMLTSGKVNDQTKTLAKLAATANALFASSGTSGVTQAQMLKLGAWDVSKAINGNITSSFGSLETITPNANAIGVMAANTGFVYKVSSIPQAACADLASGVAGFVYALHVTAASSAAPADWLTENSVVKAPGNANVSLSNLATACGNANSDFYMALKP
jgi:prepilin-type N-terminal cleavage/methylation domain-containing protein